MTKLIHRLAIWSGLVLLCGTAAALVDGETLIPKGNPEPARAVLEGLEFPVQQPVGFSEQQFNPMLKQPIVSRGQVWLEADGTMVMEIRDPTVEQRRLRGDRLSLSRPGGTNENPMRRGSVDRQLKLDPKRSTHMVLLAASALLGGDHAWLQQQFDLSLNEASTALSPAHAWELLLVPIDTRLREQLPWILLKGNASQLRSLRADRGRKGWQQLEFYSANP